MSYDFKTLKAHSSMRGGSRKTSDIKYLVIHYTSNDGDSAVANAKYFSRAQSRKASAHYFVDDEEVYQSVEDTGVAYAVGGAIQNKSHHPFYGKCTNSNSLSIEMCDTVRNGVVQITDATIQNTIELARALCKKYGIDSNHVIRHYDVNGKACPNANGLLNDSNWNAFKSKIFNGSSATIAKTKASTSTQKTSVNFSQNVKNYQYAYNQTKGYTLVEDGLIGPKTRATYAKVLVKKGHRNMLVRYIQGIVGTTQDNIFGANTQKAVINYQASKGLQADGIVGKNTIAKMVG